MLVRGADERRAHPRLGRAVAPALGWAPFIIAPFIPVIRALYSRHSHPLCPSFVPAICTLYLSPSIRRLALSGAPRVPTVLLSADSRSRPALRTHSAVRTVVCRTARQPPVGSVQSRSARAHSSHRPKCATSSASRGNASTACALVRSVGCEYLPACSYVRAPTPAARTAGRRSHVSRAALQPGGAMVRVFIGTCGVYLACRSCGCL